MKATRQEVLDKLYNHSPKPIIPCVSAKVVSIEGVTCTVVFPDNFELPGVRLKAGIDDEKEFLINTPRIGSTVLLSSLGMSDSEGEYYVVAVNEVDSIGGIIGEMSFKIDKNEAKLVLKDSSITLNENHLKLKHGNTELGIDFGNITINASDKNVTFKNNLTDLKSILNDLVNLSKNMKVLTGSPGSLSPVAPILLPNFVDLETKINNLF
jgi:hypothetical protein